MKLSKKRFAALALSAVMAVGTLSVPTFAATEVEYVEGSLKIDKDGNVTWEEHATNCACDADVVGYKDHIKIDGQIATPEKITATCARNAGVKYSYKLYDTRLFTETYEEAGTMLDHNPIVYKEEVKSAATTHGSTGTKEVWYECDNFKNCGYVTAKEIIPYDGPAHTYEEVYVSCVGWNLKLKSDVVFSHSDVDYYEVDFDDNGDFQLITATEKGTYGIFDVCTEENCKEPNWWAVTDGEWHVVNPTKYEDAYVIKVDNVSSPVVSNSAKYTKGFDALPSKDVKLEDCDEPGSYTVGYYADGIEIETKTFYYDAHHVWDWDAIKYEVTGDGNWCETETDTDTGKVTVKKNKSCRDIEYTVSATCKVCGEKYEETLIAEATGEHAIPTTLMKNLERAVKAADGKYTYANLDAFASTAAAKGNMDVPEDPFACEESGVITVGFLCGVCDALVDEMDIELAAKEHKKATPAIENKVDPDPACSGDTTYEKVVYCANEDCEYEFSRETVTIERTTLHSNETAVDKDNVAHTDRSEIVRFEYTGDVVVDIQNEKDGDRAQLGSGKYEGKNLFVKINPVSVCKEECGHEVLVEKDVHVSDIEIVKEDAEGHAGTVSCTISYTYIPAGKTKSVTYEECVEFPYFSSVYAWLNRVEEVEPEPVKDGLIYEADGLHLYEDGELVDFTGWKEYAGGTFYLENGVQAVEMDGLTLIDDEWYVMSGGQFRGDITNQAVYYDNALFWVKDGMLDTEKNGVYLYDGALCLFAGGRWARETNGIALMPNGTFYYFVEGIVATHFTGIEAYNGANFYVKSGKIDFTKTGTVVYEGQTWNVVDGAATLVK